MNVRSDFFELVEYKVVVQLRRAEQWSVIK